MSNVKKMNIYSLRITGADDVLYLNAYDIEGINQSAYFSSGNIEGDYLKVVFDCDEDPVETYLINLQDKSTMKFEGDYYLPNSIDVEGKYIYDCKSSNNSKRSKDYEYGQNITEIN